MTAPDATTTAHCPCCETAFDAGRASERQRIRVALDALTTALVRPGLGNGHAHDEAFHVVPRQALDDLLDGDGDEG